MHIINDRIVWFSHLKPVYDVVIKNSNTRFNTGRPTVRVTPQQRDLHHILSYFLGKGLFPQLCIVFFLMYVTTVVNTQYLGPSIQAA